MSRDGIRVFYTPTLRPHAVLATPIINVGSGPESMFVPPGTGRFFLTRRCKVGATYGA